MIRLLLQLLFGQIGMTPMAANGANQEGEAPPQRPPVESKPPKGTPVTRLLVSLAITAVLGAAYYYFKLPALNIHSGDLYWFIFLLCAIFSVSMIFLCGFRTDKPVEYISYAKKKLAVPFWLVVAVIIFVIGGSVIGWTLFRAYDYADLIHVEDGDFASEVSEMSWNQIPLLDENSANNLANRKLGELSDLVSQFTVSPQSAQINYQSAPVRVTYLNYGSIFKWWNNRQEGIPAYMVIDMRTQEVDVVRLEEGIKYSPSEYFSRDLMRHLRFSYPTFMFGDVNFEIDEAGTPYWIASVIDKKIGLFGGTDVAGAVLVNAITGECTYYDVADVPSWADRVYSANLLVNQYNYYGKFHNGFWNSLFGQNDCTTTTSSCNFIAQDDDVWMYTGVTSVTGDRGNIGFILINQRTKEARYYSCAGAEEYSAMSSAQGAIQQYSYEATFPLLLNISEQPTYFMALKDNAGLVKMYAMVNVQQYQIVSTGSSVSECQRNYHNLLIENGVIREAPEPEPEAAPTVEMESISGAVSGIRSANMDGDTIFYFQIDDSETYYMVNAREYPFAAILDIGDMIMVTYIPQDSKLISAQLINYK